jgi:hypothetical protein
MAGAIAFASPALLLAAFGLPLLYLLLRLLPPAARRVRLPSLRLIGDVEMPPPPSARPPLWLVLLRIGIVALALLGLAGPRWQPPAAGPAPARIAVVIDNGWASASQWARMVEAARSRIDDRDATTRYAIVPTATATAPRFVTAVAARAQLDALTPMPWPGDRARAARALPGDAAVLWIADGVEDAGATALRRAAAGGSVVVVPPTDPAIRIAGRTRAGWSGQAVSASPSATSLRVRDARASVLAEAPLVFSDGIASFRLDLDPQARVRAARLTVGSGSAQASFLADAGGDRPRVVLIEGPSNAPPLESAGFFIRRALEPHAEIASATLANAAADPAGLFILADVAADSVQAEALLRRVERGAVAILFAGPRVAENGSSLSPVPLRSGARALGGVLSWQQAQPVGGFAPNGPLAGLPVNPEARVSRQLLAQSDEAAMRWAWLADGTPMVSAARRGDGLLVLVHTAADPSWSSLPLTGLFEAMLKRLLPLAANPAALDIAATKPWQLERMLGARGEWVEPRRRVVIAADAFDTAVASEATPPGIYRSGDVRRPLNLATALGARFAFKPLDTTGLRTATADRTPVEFGGWLLFAAAMLVVVDLVVALRLRGVLVGVLLLAGAALPARAADVEIAYVTGSPAKIARGIDLLGTVLARRTAVAPGKPSMVDPARDPLGRYALLYWPADAVPRMSRAAAARLREYMANGGLVLFDFGQPLGTATGAHALLEPLGLPALAEVGPNHVLSRSFYLLPGFAGGAVWAEAGTEGVSGRVSGVIIGGGDWAALWSGDRPASPATREMAFRFGVNVVMYALTGTYKADQVHTRALLDRMDGDRR